MWLKSIISWHEVREIFQDCLSPADVTTSVFIRWRRENQSQKREDEERGRVWSVALWKWRKGPGAQECGWPLKARASLIALLVRIRLKLRRPWFDSWWGEDPLEKGKSTHSSILTHRTPWGPCTVYRVKKSQTWLSVYHFTGRCKNLGFLNYFLHMHLSHLGPLSCLSPSLVPLSVHHPEVEADDLVAAASFVYWNARRYFFNVNFPREIDA